MKCGVKGSLKTTSGTVISGQHLESAFRGYAVGSRIMDKIKNSGDNRDDDQRDHRRRMFQSGFQDHKIQLNGAVTNPRTIEMIIAHSARSDIFFAFS